MPVPDQQPPNQVLRLALWQCAPLAEVVDDHVAANLARLENTLAEVADSVDVLITPEMFLCGYNFDADVLRSRADEPGGPHAVAVAAMAARHGVAVVYGCAEIGPTGLLYNTIRCVDAAGNPIATHHKTHLFGDLDKANVAPGESAPPIFDLCGWRLSMMICYEVEFPELVRNVADDGVQAVLVPTANMIYLDEVQEFLVPARAVENQIFLAYANYVGREGDIVYGGLSEVVGPKGTMLARANREAALLRVELSAEAIDVARIDYSYLADRRLDLYR